jgi:hypothetical protein
MSTISKRTNAALWVIQALLAALFLFAGVMKFVMPIAEMTKQMPLPGTFIRFIGVCEIAGAFGLVLPGIFRIRTELTPLAARGLVIIMSGATALTLLGGLTAAILPIVTGMLAGVVAYGRDRKMTPPPVASKQAASYQIAA